jgi:hypothetical protein
MTSPISDIPPTHPRFPWQDCTTFALAHSLSRTTSALTDELPARDHAIKTRLTWAANKLLRCVGLAACESDAKLFLKQLREALRAAHDTSLWLLECLARPVCRGLAIRAWELVHELCQQLHEELGADAFAPYRTQRPVMEEVANATEATSDTEATSATEATSTTEATSATEETSATEATSDTEATSATEVTSAMETTEAAGATGNDTNTAPPRMPICAKPPESVTLDRRRSGPASAGSAHEPRREGASQGSGAQTGDHPAQTDRLPRGSDRRASPQQHTAEPTAPQVRTT